MAATTGIRPRLVSTATRTSWARSSAESVLGSAVVPQTTMPWEPSAIWYSTSLANAS